MNAPKGRFIRGRARGGGAYRPYFYFRRNGRIIPAGGARGSAPITAPVSTARGPTARRGKRGVLRLRTSTKAGAPTQDGITSSFLLPEFYAAPENALEVSCISIDSPVQCPGWRLYFPRTDYKETSDLAKRIKALEKHFSKNPANYDLLQIQTSCSFKLLPKVLLADVSLMQAWPSLMQDLQASPKTTIAAFGVAMHSVVTTAVIDGSLSLPECTRSHYYPRYGRVHKIYARPIGFVEVQLMSMIGNEELDRLYCVRGCVAAMGALQLRYSWVGFKCGRCGHEQTLKQQGFFPKRPNSCKRTDCHARDGFLEQRSSPFTQITRVQIMRLTETHLQAFDMNAEFPDMLDVELRQELVDSVTPGEDVAVTGILKIRPLADEQQQQQANTSLSAKSQNFQIYMQALSVDTMQHSGQKFSEQDLEAITMINSEPDSFKLLVRSLAPEVHGHELVKAAVLLSLFGGSGSQLHDESEINILLVGDPGVGKSSLLQTVSQISTRGVLTSGKPASAAEQQLAPVTQGRSHIALHAGALTSALTGHCSIDDIDRLASQQETLLQVMQSQTLILPFHSIFATFKTSTSIMATTNSMRGHYDHSKLITENIRVHPALLLQFHLVFLMLDKPNKNLDTSLTEHIKELHAGIKKSSAIAARYKLKPKSNNSMNVTSSEDLDDAEYDLEKRLQLYDLTADEQHELDLLPPILIKKFIAYARQQVKPLLTNEAAEEIKSFYMDLRAQESYEKQSICSTSQLEGLIRLTQARARIDFSNEATKLHVRDVLCIVRQSMSDTTVGDFIDRNPSTNAAACSGTQSSMVKKFIRILQLRSNALGRRIFDFDELKDMARRAGISCGVTNLVEVVNMQGFLLKKGPNMYEVMEE